MAIFEKRQILLTSKKYKNYLHADYKARKSKQTKRRNGKTAGKIKTLLDNFVFNLTGENNKKSKKQAKKTKPEPAKKLNIKKKHKKIVKKSEKKKPKKLSSKPKAKKISASQGKDHNLIKKSAEIGVVTHFFPKVSAAVIKLKKPLSTGEEILIKGASTYFCQKVDSMEINRVKIAKAKKSDCIGLLVKKQAHEGDKVYRNE